MIPLSPEIDWTPLIKAHQKQKNRKVISLKRKLLTYDGETYYEFDVEGKELKSYTIKIKTNKYGARGSCHCHDFRYRKLPRFKRDGEMKWCKHLLNCYMAIQEIEWTKSPETTN
jgi:hypothetical protein